MLTSQLRCPLFVFGGRMRILIGVIVSYALALGIFDDRWQFVGYLEPKEKTVVVTMMALGIFLLYWVITSFFVRKR